MLRTAGQRRRVFVIACCAAALGIAAGCGENTPGRSEATAGAQEITMSQNEGDETPAPGPVANAEQAAAGFERFWQEELSGRLGDDERRAWLDSLIEAQTPTTTPMTRAEYAARAGELLHGSPDDLRGDGECWAVHYDGMLSTGLSACVDAATGEVLVVQETPEG